MNSTDGVMHVVNKWKEGVAVEGVLGKGSACEGNCARGD